MKHEHRNALLNLTARRGPKGFSGVLEEAVETFLGGEVNRETRRKTLLSLGGVLSAKDADQLRRTTRDLRQNLR